MPLQRGLRKDLNDVEPAREAGKRIPLAEGTAQAKAWRQERAGQDKKMRQGVWRRCQDGE